MNDEIQDAAFFPLGFRLYRLEILYIGETVSVKAWGWYFLVLGVL
jgi:hypothetical protein